MARVCTDWFPPHYFSGIRYYNYKPGFFMDDFLKEQLDILIKNIKNDWDFTIIISGRGEVRVGKSVLGMQIAAYWAHQMWEVHKIKVSFNLKDNWVFDGRKLIEHGNNLGEKFPYSPLLYDEAGADLAGTKVMQSITQDVLDYFRECGQYNMLNILILPDFFELPVGIAITRSIFLIDVDYKIDENDIFTRGYFHFYSRPNKKDLYIDGKKRKDYNAAKHDFPGIFRVFYPINELEYRKLKREALRHRENRGRNITIDQRDCAWAILHENYGMKFVDIAKNMTEYTGRTLSQDAVEKATKRFLSENS